jgi:flavin reductase (DIM6/NTAB) family NADH-FMN oxidoreductase RutF
METWKGAGMTPERVGRHLGGGREPEEERVERERRERLREVLSFWATGVSILAVREGGAGSASAGAVHALTVSGFMPVSVEPPLVLVSLGPNASALPYLDPGTRFVVSILRPGQKGLAARFADTFPVGPSPFPPEGAPVVAGSLAALTCEVDELLVRGDHTLVVGRVVEASSGEDAAALAYFRRGYHSIGNDS